MSHQDTAGNINAASIVASSSLSVTARGLVLSVHEFQAPTKSMESQDDEGEVRLGHRDRDSQNRGRTLTRTDLARAVVNWRNTVSLSDAKFLVDGVIEEVISALAEGHALRLRNFGSFLVRAKSARPGRDLRTGEVVPIAARKVAIFRASPKMRAAVNGEAPRQAPERRGEGPLATDKSRATGEVPSVRR